MPKREAAPVICLGSGKDTCPTCEGACKVEGKECPDCGGLGKVTVGISTG